MSISLGAGTLQAAGEVARCAEQAESQTVKSTSERIVEAFREGAPIDRAIAKAIRKAVRDAAPRRRGPVGRKPRAGKKGKT